MWPIAAFAVEAAEEAPRAFDDGGTTLATDALDSHFVHQLGRACRQPSRRRPYWSAELPPHLFYPLMSAFAGTAQGELRDRTVVVGKHRGEARERRHAAFWAMVALVFAGLPTTRTRTSSAKRRR